MSEEDFMDEGNVEDNFIQNEDDGDGESYSPLKSESKFDNLPEEVIANICSCFMRNSTTNTVERNSKVKQDFSENSLFEYEDFHTVNIDDLIDIYPLSLVNSTIRNKILNNNHLWNEEMIVDLSEFSKSTKLFKYMNKINDWNYSSSDNDLIVTVERERLNIALSFLSCLGLSEYIKKLKVSCILKEVGLTESISWSKLIIDSFPNLTDIVYYSLTDKNVVQRYESLDCSGGGWKNLKSVMVYFDFKSLVSLVENHKSTIKSISFAPKMSEKNTIQTLLENSKLIENVDSIVISTKFESSMIESNKNYLHKFGSIIIDCLTIQDIEFLIPKLTHLKKLVLERVNSLSKLENIHFSNLTELVISFDHETNLFLKDITAPELQVLTFVNANIESSLESFNNLQSLKLSNCDYDQEFWIQSHTTLKYFSLFFSESRDSSDPRSFSLANNQSLLCISLTSLESVSISNVSPSCKLFLEKCRSIDINTNRLSEVCVQNYYSCRVVIKGDHCQKLQLPKIMESCKILLESIGELSCYYLDDYTNILPVKAHNISLDKLYVSCFKPPAFLKEFLTSFKNIRICNCMLSHDHTYTQVFYNVSPSSSIAADMSNYEKIITHGDISLLHYLNNCTSLRTLISGSKLICSSGVTYLSNTLTHLETSIANFSSLVKLPNLRELIIAHSESIDIDLSQYPCLEDFSITYSKNVNIKNSSESMERMKFILLESISVLSLSIDNVRAPNIREVIIHSIKSIESGTEPIFKLSHSPKLLFYYVSFVWKPGLKAKTQLNHGSEQPSFTHAPPKPVTQPCQLL